MNNPDIKVVSWVDDSWVVAIGDAAVGFSFQDQSQAKMVADWLRFSIREDNLPKFIRALKGCDE